jgi:hypothetical protein
MLKWLENLIYDLDYRIDPYKELLLKGLILVVLFVSTFYFTMVLCPTPQACLELFGLGGQ